MLKAIVLTLFSENFIEVVVIDFSTARPLKPVYAYDWWGWSQLIFLWIGSVGSSLLQLGTRIGRKNLNFEVSV